MPLQRSGPQHLGAGQSADAAYDALDAYYALNSRQADPGNILFSGPCKYSTFRPKRMSLLANDTLYHSDEYKQRRAQEAPGYRGHGDNTTHIPKMPTMPKMPKPTSTTSAHYQNLDPDTAFRESVLDALADAQGAAYWQSVYGVDLSTIPRTKINPVTGTTERTTDEQRVAYARRMIFEAQNGPRRKNAEKKEEEGEAEAEAAPRNASADADDKKRRQRKERARAAEANRRMQKEIERSLRRGEERRKRATIQSHFDEYSRLWREWDGAQATIPWPTLSGGRSGSGMTEKEIRSFFVRGLELKAVGGKEFVARLKEQRVRWHPDKMQHKMGGKGPIKKGVMAEITMIFQVIDTLYDDVRMAN